MTNLFKGVADTLRRAARRAVPQNRTDPQHHTGHSGSSGRTAGAGGRRAPPGGRHLAYSPDLDGAADPGEIVWTWVPYEDDPAQGKDRPVLVVGRDGRTLLGLMLSSQSERDGQRHWLSLGPGDWDRESRPSWIRLDRVLTIDEGRIRREGSVLDRARFERIAGELRQDYGWR